MKSILKNMQETVAKYARVLSQILQVDVEIVDHNLKRIAGTGMFFNRIDQSLEDEGHVYKDVIKTGEKRIIKMPGKHEICKRCPKLLKQGFCEETFEMSTPIKIGNKVIGVIGFVCFNKEQRKHILDNFDTFLEFLDQISDLIASKAREEIEKQNMLSIIDLLNSIIDKIEQGVMIIDDKKTIIKLNNTAKKILNIGDEGRKSIVLNPTGNMILDLREYKLEIEGEKYLLAGEEYDILQNDLKYNKVFIFADIDSLKYKALNATTSKENMGLDTIIGKSQEIEFLKEKVKKIAPSPSTVLIIGESGTGKELFARAIHIESDRKDYPFVAINCAAIPDTLLESELFGYVKGAFTGADPKGKMGKIEFANKGTLFLDEIGDMPLYLQSKFLRVLEQKEITRLGANKPIPIDVRFVAATNKNLEKLIKEKSFREDLYYRLNVIPFFIPPLRERKEDIKVLADFFIAKYSGLFDKKVLGVQNEVWEYLYDYHWPGNVRELENTIEYMINMLDKKGVITTELLPPKILNDKADTRQSLSADEILTLEQVEKNMIEQALEQFGDSVDSKQKAAEALGIGIATLYRKIKKYDL